MVSVNSNHTKLIVFWFFFVFLYVPNVQYKPRLDAMNVTPALSQLQSTPAFLATEQEASSVQSEQVDDLFSAHDFDIHIDLPSGEDGKYYLNLY